jgi:hypothetical protein
VTWRLCIGKLKEPGYLETVYAITPEMVQENVPDWAE